MTYPGSILPAEIRPTVVTQASWSPESLGTGRLQTDLAWHVLGFCAALPDCHPINTVPSLMMTRKYLINS